MVIWLDVGWDGRGGVGGICEWFVFKSFCKFVVLFLIWIYCFDNCCIVFFKKGVDSKLVKYF